MVNWFLPYGFQYSFMFISYCLLLISGESIFSPLFSPRHKCPLKKSFKYYLKTEKGIQFYPASAGVLEYAFAQLEQLLEHTT